MVQTGLGPDDINLLRIFLFSHWKTLFLLKIYGFFCAKIRNTIIRNHGWGTCTDAKDSLQLCWFYRDTWYVAIAWTWGADKHKKRGSCKLFCRKNCLTRNKKRAVISISDAGIRHDTPKSEIGAVQSTAYVGGRRCISLKVLIYWRFYQLKRQRPWP